MMIESSVAALFEGLEGKHKEQVEKNVLKMF
jgi:hypothetical protein